MSAGSRLAIGCFPFLALAVFANAFATSPVQGTWYNSYCSRVDLVVDATGAITGVYTSHTGSTGSSSVVGYIDPNAQPAPPSPVPENPSGIPFSLGIQWRLINVPAEQADGSWHWVSTFAGQYHQKQDVVVPGQTTYQIDDTLEILNGLIATAVVPGFTDIAPVMWPQTLRFHRSAPSYCEPVNPPGPAPYTPTAPDHVTGSWVASGGLEKMTLKASLSEGTVVGSYQDADGNSYVVSGLFDTIAPDPLLSDVAQQGVALTLYDAKNARLVVMAGGINLNFPPIEMSLWSGKLKSTGWTDRFTQSTLDKVTWVKTD